MLDLTGQAVDNLTLSQASAEIGAIRQTRKDPADFSNETLGVWMLMDGQSCSGTQYETDFGESNVPDAYTEGAFFRQAKAGRGLGTYEADEIASHSHANIMNHAPALNFSGGTYPPRTPNSSQVTGSQGGSTGGAETRPKNIAVNFMIKVGH